MSKVLRFNLLNKEAGFQFEKGDDAAIMRGFATLYDFSTDLGYFTMSIDRHAFKESIERGDEVVSLVNHDLNLLLGRTPNTLSLKWDDAHGLFCETQLPKHYLGDFAREALERGDFNQMSVGFMVREETLSREEGKTPHFHVTKADLFDVSVVTFAQIPETSVEVVSGSLSSNRATVEDLQALMSRHIPKEELPEAVEFALEPYMLKQRLREKIAK